MVTEVQPLARDLRQSFAACRARTGATVGQVLLVGGGSRLRGLASYLPSSSASRSRLLADDVDGEVGSRRLAGRLADAAARCGRHDRRRRDRRPLFDLRQGPLAAKVDLSFLRAKAGRSPPR